MRPWPWILALALLLPLAAPALAGDDGPADCDADETWDAAEEECVDVEEPEECDEDEVLDPATGDCEDAERPETCDEDEVLDPATGECEDVERPESCDDDEVFDASTGECEDVETPEECDEDEVFVASTGECEDVEEPESCDEDEVLDPATGECEDVEGPEACDEDEVFVASTGECEDADEAECVESERESEREETLPNGTRFKEKVEEKTRDCPGTEHDRVEVERRVEWREASGERRRERVEHRIENDREDVRVEMRVRGADDLPHLNVTMRRNASVLALAGADRALPGIEVSFLELVEFEDTDGRGAFDLDDRVVATWLVADLPVAVSSDNGTITVSYALPGNGTLAFVHREMDGRAKFDIVIRDHAYATGASQLALRAAFVAENAAYRRDLGNPALVTVVDGRLASFDWVETVEADGVERPVRATVYVGDGEARGTAQLYLAYPRADTVVHDPSLGYAVQSVSAVVVEALFHPGAYAAAAVGAVAFLAAGYAARKRK